MNNSTTECNIPGSDKDKGVLRTFIWIFTVISVIGFILNAITLIFYIKYFKSLTKKLTENVSFYEIGVLFLMDCIYLLSEIGYHHTPDPNLNYYPASIVATFFTFDCLRKTTFVMSAYVNCCLALTRYLILCHPMLAIKIIKMKYFLAALGVTFLLSIPERLIYILFVYSKMTCLQNGVVTYALKMKDFDTGPAVTWILFRMAVRVVPGLAVIYFTYGFIQEFRRYLKSHPGNGQQLLSYELIYAHTFFATKFIFLCFVMETVSSISKIIIKKPRPIGWTIAQEVLLTITSIHMGSTWLVSLIIWPKFRSILTRRVLTPTKKLFQRADAKDMENETKPSYYVDSEVVNESDFPDE